jgi:hypothetical protein
VFANYLSAVGAGNASRDSVQLDVRFATLDTPLVSAQVRMGPAGKRHLMFFTYGK